MRSACCSRASRLSGPRLALREGPADPDEGDPAELLRHPLRNPRIWRLSLGSSLLVWPQIAVLAFVVIFLEEARGFSTAGAAAVLAAINVAGAFGRLTSGRLSDRLGRRVAPLAFAPLVDATSWRVGFAATAAVPVPAILVLRPLER